MPTPSHDPESGLPLLPDDIFDLIRDSTRDRFEQLSAATREAFDRTSRWHLGQRQALDLVSLVVDGKPYREALADVEAAGKKGKQ